MTETNSALHSYYQDGATWENDVIKKERRGRIVAQAVAAIASVTALAAIGAVVMLTPLKSFEPYLVIVDKNTGYIETKSARDTNLNALTTTEKQAVTQANTVRFIRAREGYDPYQIDENFGIAGLLSTGDASRDLRDLFSATNPKNPVKVYGKTKRVKVDVKAVTFPNDTTALVRFSAEEKSDTDFAVRHYVAVVRYRYTTQPATNSWLFENPLGFQVTSYRRDQETVSGSAGE